MSQTILANPFEFVLIRPKTHSDTEAACLKSRRNRAGLMRKLQSLRGNAYKEYPGIASRLTEDGRDVQLVDDHCWHILIVAKGLDQVVGGIRYRPSIASFEDLICNEAELATGPHRVELRSAFKRYKREAEEDGKFFGEVSGLALSPDLHGTPLGGKLLLLSFALAVWLGGESIWATVSTRHNVSVMLQRLGAERILPSAPSFEPLFGTAVDLLHMKRMNLPLRFSRAVEQAESTLSTLKLL